jgi:hypothetical protein
MCPIVILRFLRLPEFTVTFVLLILLTFRYSHNMPLPLVVFFLQVFISYSTAQLHILQEIVFRHIHKTETWASNVICLYICPSFSMEQLDSHWMHYHKIWYLRIFWKSVEKIQVSLKSDVNNGYFTWRLGMFMTVFHWALFRMRNV